MGHNPSLEHHLGVRRVYTFLRVDGNFIAAALLGIVYFISYRRLERSDAFNRRFFNGCRIILAMLLFEAATCFLNGHPSAAAKVAANLLHVCLFATPPVLTYFWLLLAKTLTERASVRDMRANHLHLIPVALNGAAALLSPFFHWIFFIDSAGVYHRGPLFLVSLAVSYGYLLTGFLILLRRRKKLLRQEFLFLSLFCLLPMAGGLLQGLIYGPLFMWPCSACGLIVMYLFLEERMVQTDSLTGVWTRNSFEHYISQLLQADGGKPFGVIYCDIDDFKGINDRYGHPEGDEAIRTFAETVKGMLRKGDAIARMGGDEFAILVNVEDEEALKAVKDRILAALELFNRTTDKGYAIRCSAGADMFRKSEDVGVEDLLRRVDHLMYVEKHRKKEEGPQDAGA
jgi:diguanylate cyclase (GGDEF)-like protein